MGIPTVDEIIESVNVYSKTKDHELIIVDTKGMPPTSDFKLKWKMMKFKYPMYTYKCLKGIGRDKRKGIMHYQTWEQVKGC